MKVSVVIPAKDELAGLKKVLPKLINNTRIFEIIVVSDGSTDGTVDYCREIGVTVVSHPYSKGNGASIKTGARAASGDVLVFMDGDGQHQPEEIDGLLATYESGYDLVVGARCSDGQASIARGLANKVYNNLAGWITGRRIDDLTSGFRVVNAKRFSEFLYMLPNGFSYPTTSTMAFLRSGYSVAFSPIQVLQRDGKSHLNIFSDGLKFFLIIFKVATLYSPLKLFSVLSAATFLMGLGYYIYTYVAYDRFTNMGLIFFLSSVFIFLIGLISEQISTLFYKK